MKVKDLISKLDMLDPERDIWIFYDYPCAALEPIIEGEANEFDSKNFKGKVKVGDYYINAW